MWFPPAIVFVLHALYYPCTDHHAHTATRRSKLQQCCCSGRLQDGGQRPMTMQLAGLPGGRKQQLNFLFLPGTSMHGIKKWMPEFKILLLEVWHGYLINVLSACAAFTNSCQQSWLGWKSCQYFPLICSSVSWHEFHGCKSFPCLGHAN
jgi:hypothetical protein